MGAVGRQAAGRAVRALRSAAGLSRMAAREAAWDRCRVSLVGLPAIERGERCPTPHQLEAVRLVYEVSFTRFKRLLAVVRGGWRERRLPAVERLADWHSWLLEQTPAPPRTRLVAAPYPGGIHLRAMNASKPMKVRVTPAEAELIRAAAAGSQKTVATWIRDTVIDAVEQGDTEFNASWVNAQDREQLPYRLPASAALMRRLDRLRNGTPLALWVRYLVVDRARRALAEPTEEAKATGTNG